MKIIITENQNYVLRRLQQFIDIVEDQIEGYELHEDGSWWCDTYNPNTFFDNLRDRSIEEFVSQNWNFFHDHSENGGSDMDLGFVPEIWHGHLNNSKGFKLGLFNIKKILSKISSSSHCH
jgi:hypothetical protein